MIYVLSNNRIETMKWARSQELTLLKVRHVQNLHSLPGVLNPRTTRLVQLPGWARRRDTFAVKARLRQATRRGKIEIEEWAFSEEDGYYKVDAANEQPADASKPEAVEFPGPIEAENTSGEPEAVLTQDNFLEIVGKNEDIAAGLANAEPHEATSEVSSASYAEGEGATASVARNTLPSSPAEKATEPVDFVKKRDDEITEVQGAVEQTRDDLDEVAAAMDELVEASKPEEQLEKMLKPEAKKRVRRTNAQIAYDTALVEWESNGGAVEAVQEARTKLKKGDPRLAEDPTAADDLDF